MNEVTRARRVSITWKRGGVGVLSRVTRSRRVEYVRASSA